MSTTVARGPENVVDVQCPNCGGWRTITARSARRASEKCKLCLNSPEVKEPTDADMLFWLRRFDDHDLLLIAWAWSGIEGKVENMTCVRAQFGLAAAA